jgi:CheY-like chemotaxis protein
MSNKTNILIVEDDEFAALVAAEVLAPDHAVQHVADGLAALKSVAARLPDLVLLDVHMPGMSGYEVCRALRDDPSTSRLPIIFLSGMTSEADRMAGYDAGGDDYLVKPASADELRSKVRIALANNAERRALKTDLSQAFSTAMAALSSAAEIGAILQFLRTSFGCPDYSALCQEVLNTLASYGLQADVQLRGQQKTVSRGPEGPCSPLEESVLTNMATHGRLFEFGSRLSFSYERITIIVKGEIDSDAARHGRMRDNVALLAEGADARVAAMDNAAVVAAQHAALAQLTASTRKALQDIDQHQRDHGTMISDIFHDLQKNFERSLLTLGITDSQECELAEMLQDAAKRAGAVYDDGLKIGVHLETILKQLENAEVQST